jgi:hypothetical protein
MLYMFHAVVFHTQVLFTATTQNWVLHSYVFWLPIEYRTITRGVNIGYQNLGSPLHQKQEISSTGRCLETAFYILTFYVLILNLYLNFDLNNFSNTVRQLPVI